MTVGNGGIGGDGADDKEEERDQGRDPHPCRRHKTSFKTDEPSTALITGGPYRYTRNPIYLALSLLYAGIGIAADSPWVLVLLAPLLVVIHYGVIIREERYLERKFADAYRRYKATTRRWL